MAGIEVSKDLLADVMRRRYEEQIAALNAEAGRFQAALAVAENRIDELEAEIERLRGQQELPLPE